MDDAFFWSVLLTAVSSITSIVWWTIQAFKDRHYPIKIVSVNFCTSTKRKRTRTLAGIGIYVYKLYKYPYKYPSKDLSNFLWTIKCFGATAIGEMTQHKCATCQGAQAVDS